MNWTDAFQPYAGGRISEPGTLQDKTLAGRLAAYKRQVAKRYRVLDPEGLERQLPAGNLFVSTKVDGELWFLVKREGEVALCAYNGRVLQGVPLTAEAEKLLSGVDSAIVAGELFAIPTDGRPRCYHVSKALSDAALASGLRFQAFDLVEDGGKDMLLVPYSERWKRLGALFAKAEKLGLVSTVEGDAAAAAGCYREWVATQKFEGIVVRSEQGLTYKVKPTFSIDALVVAFGERVTDGIGQLRELTVALLRDDGTLQILGSVGGGFSEDDRVAWHQKLSKLEVPSAFRLANREGTLCRFVEPKVVVEVRCSDLVDTDADDAPIQRMALRFEPGAGYTAVGPMPIASMVSPVFLRERADKVADAASVGLDQTYSRLPFQDRFAAVSQTARKASEIVRRGVYTKETKGQTAVRKYVAIATNKADGRNYPAFVVHMTDYSAGRAEPLKTSIRVASTREGADKHIEAWITENVKRGWVEVGASPKAEAPKPEAPAAEPVAALAEAASAAPAAEAAPKKRRSKKAAEPEGAPATEPAAADGAEAAPKKRSREKAET